MEKARVDVSVEFENSIRHKEQIQAGEASKPTVTTAPTRPEAAASRDENRRTTAPAGAKLRRAIDVLWEFGCCLDMFFSSGERKSAKKRRPASFIPARRLQAALQNRFRRPAAGATAGSCFSP